MLFCYASVLRRRRFWFLSIYFRSSMCMYMFVWSVRLPPTPSCLDYRATMRTQTEQQPVPTNSKVLWLVLLAAASTQLLFELKRERHENKV